MHSMHFEPAARLPPKQKAPVQSMLLSPPSRQPAHRSHRQPSQPPTAATDSHRSHRQRSPSRRGR